MVSIIDHKCRNIWDSLSRQKLLGGDEGVVGGGRYPIQVDEIGAVHRGVDVLSVPNVFHA